MNFIKLYRKLALPALALAVLALAETPSFAQNTVIVDLAAVEAEWTAPDGVTTVPMWDFVVDPGACTAIPPIPAWDPMNPAINAMAGDTLVVNLRNCLAEPVSFFVPGLRASSATGGTGRFTAEAAAGSMASYTFTLTPGTFLFYSATDKVRTQVPMGLYGALVVDQATGTAYPGVEYSQDEVLIFSAIDPGLNADPALSGGARVISWNPQFFLINGQASPNTATIAFTAGDNVLLRLVNAGIETVVPTLEGGLYMDLVAEDGNPCPAVFSQYGIELTAGKTIDARVQATNPGAYALYDRALHLTNKMATGGGMLTYLDVAAGAGIFQLDAAAYSVNENGGSLTVTVDRVGGSAGTVTVDYATADGTATQPSDYTGKTGTLEFFNTQTSASFGININDDTTYEGDETFGVSLSSPTGGAILGTPSSAVVTIVDDEESPGALQFSAAAYSVNENGGSLTVTVDRVGGSAGTVTVDYATADGTATQPSDYTSKTGTLEFLNTQTSASFGININDDTTYEGDETFGVSLSSPSGGAILGTPSSAVVTIVENDPAPNVAPTANDDFATVIQNSTDNVINVTANDDDPDGTIDVATVVITTGTTTLRGGTVSVNLDGTVTYTPKRGIRGTDTFEYTVNDNDGATSNVAEVVVNVVK